MFQSIYDSAWYAPGLFWLSGLLFLVYLVRDRPFVFAFLVLFTVEIMVDALVTGGVSPTQGHPALHQQLAILFVILGDFRYFLLVERFVAPGGSGSSASPSRSVSPNLARITALALGQSLLIPVLSYAVMAAVPSTRENPRVTFLVYEAMFTVLALVLRFFVLPRRLKGRPEAEAQFLRSVTSFVLVQYAGWALADVLILSGASWGYGVRLIPNTMYYAGFLPYVYLKAPKELVR
jgi:hypothetical protein